MADSERALELPCDRHLPGADDAWHRAVDVEAPAAAVFRRLCQLRAAPYSYDWVDNFGRRSPRQLTPGLERLEEGQRMMRIFHLAEFERDREITIVLDRRSRIFGDVAVTYAAIPAGDHRSRLLARVMVAYPGPRFLRPLARRMLPLGDLVMMRKQLRTLKRLAERDAGSTRPESDPAW